MVIRRQTSTGFAHSWLKLGADFVTLEIVARPGARRHGPIRVEAREIVSYRRYARPLRSWAKSWITKLAIEVQP